MLLYRLRGCWSQKSQNCLSNLYELQQQTCKNYLTINKRMFRPISTTKNIAAIISTGLTVIYLFRIFPSFLANTKSAIVFFSIHQQAAGEDGRHVLQLDAPRLRQDQPEGDQGKDGQAAVEVEGPVGGEGRGEAEEGEGHQQVPAPVHAYRSQSNTHVL